MTQVLKTKGLFAVRSVEPIRDDWRHNPWLHEALEQIKACVTHGIFAKYPGVKVKPTWIPIADEEQLGPPLRCTLNTQQYVKNNEGATVLRCFKIFTDCNPNLRHLAGEHQGAKCVLHTVVRTAGGEMLDVTCEPGDAHAVCVLVDWDPDLSHVELIGCYHSLGSVCLGTATRVNAVMHSEQSTDTTAGCTDVFADVEVLRIRELPMAPWVDGVLARNLGNGRLRQLCKTNQVSFATAKRWVTEAVAVADALGLDYVEKVDRLGPHFDTERHRQRNV